MPNSHENSLEYLFLQYHRELLAFTGQRFGSETAEDLVQETYLRFLQHTTQETINNPRAYLYKMAANLGADRFRYDQVRSRHAANEDIDFDQVAQPSPGPDADTDAQQQLQRCLTALASLPDIYRHVFLLHRIDGMTHKEIGSALGLPRRTVERYCAKALAHCFEQLGSYHD
ncbi:MAG: sigma-70 family RNA polymerase sigma factor [Methylovulum sp.]|nr:sigma-70 family RNA polymerase sigma factor [Methylovulum sp.]